MPRLMIVVASVRPGRVGLPIAQWAHSRLANRDEFDIDFVDLAELALPMMDEPNHPRLRNYVHEHTKAWSARVEAADAFVFVTPEYNHSYSGTLKNALDFLSQEWWRKPVGFVSYGGISAGSRGVVALEPVLVALGLVKTGAAVEISFPSVTDGVFISSDKHSAILDKMAGELAALSEALRPLR